MDDHRTFKKIKSLPFKTNFQVKPELSIWCWFKSPATSSTKPFPNDLDLNAYRDKFM